MATFSLGTFAKLYFVLMVIVTPVNVDSSKETMKRWGKMCVEDFGGKPVYELEALIHPKAKKKQIKIGIVYCEQMERT